MIHSQSFLSGSPFLLMIIFNINVAQSFAQDFQRAYGTNLDNSFSKVIKDGSHYYVLGQNEASDGATQFGTVTRLDSNGLHLWTLEPNIASVWNDAVLTPTGDLLVVGSTLPFDASSKSLIGLVTPAGGGDFTWLRSYLEPGTNKNSFTRIVKNPNPLNAAFPYYVLGTQTKNGDPSINDVVLLNLNTNGTFNFKKKYESSLDNDFARDLELAGGGTMLLAGNNRIEGHVGKECIYLVDNSGTMLSGAQFDAPDGTFTDVAVSSTGEIYATLTTITNSAQFMKFSSDLGLIGTGAIPQLTAANQIWEGNEGEIYATGRGNFGGVARDVILKVTEAGVVLDWVKYLNTGTSFQSGSSWLMPNGQIAYTDSRIIPGGFGQNCAFISLSDGELNTCGVSEGVCSIQFLSPLGNGPILPLALFQEIPVGTDITIFQALDWQQAEVCSPNPCIADFTYEINCGVVSFIDQSTLPNSPTWDWVFNIGDLILTSTQQNPVVTFPECGLYQVCLQVTGDSPSTSCTICQSVSVSDNVPPVARCLGIGVVLDANCNAVITPQQIDDGSTDDCLLQSMSVSPDMIHGCGLFPVTLTVTDWCGNTATCMTNVQANEDIPPMMRCPSNVTVTASSPAPCSKIVNNLQPTNVSDNCSTPSVTYTVTGATSGSGANSASGLTFNQGISTVTYLATDACGNSTSCSFTVTVLCSCQCTNNLVQNGGFFEGSTAGNLGGPGHSAHWEDINQSPQIVTNDGCCDSTCVQMWGWLYNGESIAQQGVNFLAGHQYKISFCAKFVTAGSYTDNVSFGFTGSNSLLNAFQCNGCENIGSSPQIYSTTWTNYTLPVWKPTQNFNNLLVRVFNINGIKTWGRIDNICVQEVFRPCCTDEEAFIENIRNAVNFSFDENTQEGIMTIGNLPECDSITSIDWGDGHVDNGPFGSNRVKRNRFLDHLLAKIHFQAHEYNQDVLPNPVCFDHFFSDSINVVSSGTCACSSFSELFIRGSRGVFSQLVDCGESPYNLPCFLNGASYSLTGLYQCLGDVCADEATIQWSLAGPDSTYTSASLANPFFAITLLPSFFKQPGLYTLTLNAQCGNQSCPCVIQFNVDCPDPCPCTLQDKETLRDAVDHSFARIMRPDYGCSIHFSPLALSDCETIRWFINDTIGTPIGESVGNEPFSYTLPGSGTYVIIMQVTRKKADGSVCDKLMRSQNVTVTCQTLPECANSDIENPTFSEGAVAGYLNSGGHSNGWKANSGNPKLNESQIASLDGWTMQLSGNIDTGDILTLTDPICLAKLEGMISVRIAVGDSAPGGFTFKGKPTKDQFNIQFFRGDQFNFNACDDNCRFYIGSVELRSGNGEWVEIQIPYDLSKWIPNDSCEETQSVSVRPAIYLSNELGSNQGSERTLTVANIDNFCLNGTLVALHDPPQKQSILIYPNPTTGELILRFTGVTPTSGAIEVFDLYGRLMRTEKLLPDVDSHMLSISELPSGVYFVKVLDNSLPVRIEKIIKE